MRKNRIIVRQNKLKTQLFITGGVLLVLIISLAVMYVVYNNKLKNISQSLIETEQITALVPNITEEKDDTIEQVSTQISKNIEEIIEELDETEENKTEENNVTETQAEVKEEKEKETTKIIELKFEYPVDGEIIKEFANENLVFSETLQEWTTHNGIDIKADRTTVVKAAEGGTVTAIKNDPRYGLTIVIEHENKYKTIYANLLTTEFVKEGEKVSRGQTIGTVGNSAAFEIADEAHLHFEMIQDGKYVDPILYLNK